MILRIKYFLLFAIYPFLLLSQVVDKIEVNTNSSISESEIISWTQTGKGLKIYKGILDSLKSRIAFNLSLKGFFNPEFEGSKLDFSADSQKVNIVLNIDEGEPTFISNVNFTSNDSLQLKTFLPVFQFLQGQVFDKNEIEEYINDALTRLENNGHPFAVFTITSVHFYYDSTEDKNFTDLYIKLNTENESKIDKIEVQGNESTRDYVVIRELRIDPGEQYSQDKIEELPRRLNRLRFFEPVTVPQFYMDSDDNGVLLITVKERQTNNFDGIIGYVPPSNDNESGYLTGLVDVSLRNLFGTGRAAAFRWRKIDRNSQELELKYLEPWLFSFPINFDVRFFQRQQDTIYVQRTIAGGLEYLATEDVSVAVFVSSESTIPTLSEEPIFTVFNSTSLTTGINLKIDTRDDPLAPRSGILFINSYKFSRKNINGPPEFITPGTETDINLQRFEATLALFFELFSTQVIAFDINGRELRGPFFEESDLYRLGGANSLRGYREDQFIGNRIYWTNLEYRFFLSQRTFAFLFFDTGYFLRNADEVRDIPKQEAFKIGYGFGINLETAIGILGVSFALAKGDSFSDGLIHFGIINEF
ncbi:MAG: BamA/TamA family outer membrane protein [Bacteroidetes bacterium]|nr:BamA/TamA family outer membrane protein [Bacteroidota bacterium]